MYCKATGCVDTPHKHADSFFDAWNERMLKMRQFSEQIGLNVGPIHDYSIMELLASL